VTCVVGIRGTAGVLLAADSQTSWDNRKMMDAQPKVFELSDVLAIGYCGSGRLGQLLQHGMAELDDPPLGRDEHVWAVKTFVPFVRDVLETGGFLHVHHNVEHFGDSAFLFAVRHRLFQVEGDLCVNEHERPYDAVGSGCEVAIGAMAALVGDADAVSERTIVDVAIAGVQAPIEHTHYVGGDIAYRSTVCFTDDERAFARSMLKRKAS
jgi:20S proteasome alpha/beta subunit